MTDKDPTTAGTVRLAIERDIFNGDLAPEMPWKKRDWQRGSACRVRRCARPSRSLCRLDSSLNAHINAPSSLNSTPGPC